MKLKSPNKRVERTTYPVLSWYACEGYITWMKVPP